MLKYKPMYWYALESIIKNNLKKKYSKDDTKIILLNAKKEYKYLLSIADDIGSNNPMASNMYMCLLFLSFLTGNKEKVKEEDLKELISTTLNSKIVDFLISRNDMNREKDIKKFGSRIHRSANWIEKHKSEYPESWEFNFDDTHKDGVYYYFTKCPIAKFFKDNNLENLTHIFCEIDYLTIEKNRAKLHREHTLASGDKICDFWIVGDKLKCPK